MIKIINMPTDVIKPKPYLTLTDDNGNYVLSISEEELSGDIAFYEEQEDMGDIDTTKFHFTINKADWIDIKTFIDEQFKL